MRRRNYVFYTKICHWLFLLLSLPLVAFFILLEDLHSFYQEEFNRGELQKGCSLVKGEVYHVNTGKYHYMNYSFVINGKKYNGVSRYGLWEKKHGRLPDEGDSVLICYKKYNPEINMLQEYLDYESTFFVHKWAKEIYLKIHAKKQ